MRKLLELGSAKPIGKLDAHGSRTLRQVIKCFAIYVNGTMSHQETLLIRILEANQHCQYLSLDHLT